MLKHGKNNNNNKLQLQVIVNGSIELILKDFGFFSCSLHTEFEERRASPPRKWLPEIVPRVRLAGSATHPIVQFERNCRAGSSVGQWSLMRPFTMLPVLFDLCDNPPSVLMCSLNNCCHHQRKGKANSLKLSAGCGSNHLKTVQTR